MYENETLVQLLKEIANDENLDEFGRQSVRLAIRATAKFMLYDVAWMNKSMTNAVNELENMFPGKTQK